ncbi:MAG: hypothetical protein GXO77_07100 [Calditrichaeota bacterium]|nr:hypothetical protein [Calditrichota bacterium]
MRRLKKFPCFLKLTLSLGLISSLLIPSDGYGQSATFSARQVIDDDLEKAKKNVVIDIDLDNDRDIICTANPEGSAGAEDDAGLNVVLYLNDGAESFTRKTIDYRFRTARGLAAGDLNGDGYPDVAVGNSNVDSSLVWYVNPVTDYNSRWRKYQVGVAAPFNYIVLIYDLDGDGNPDIVDGMGDAALGNPVTGDFIRWLKSDGGVIPSFTENQLINYQSPSGIAIGDFDGDTDDDIAGMGWTDYSSLTASTDEDVRWWAQASLSSWNQQEIIKTAYGGNDIQAADIDNDGDIDLLGAGYKNQSVDWWANDGTGLFGSSMFTIRSSFQYARNVQVVDLDGDADLDVVSCADSDNLVVWFENDGNQNFTEYTIDNSFTYAYFVTANDLDGDGDIDIIGTAEQAVETGGLVLGQLAWWENYQAEEQTIASGDPAPVAFNSGKVVIDYQSGYTGGNTTVFYNHGSNSNRSKVGAGINHIAVSGFYTITTNAGTYDATIDFYYDGITEWSAVNNETDLRICYWDANSQTWILAGTAQNVDDVNNKISVSGITTQLHKYSLFTLGSSSTDNSLPVQLLLFTYQKETDGIWLQWETASELDNLGFEIWRRIDADTTKELIASFETDDRLKGLGNSNLGRQYEYFDQNVLPGKTYFYELKDVSYAGRKSTVARLSVAFVPKGLTRVVENTLPDRAELLPNYPNPFNNSTIIEIKIPENSETSYENVSLVLFDLSGRRVRTLFSGALSGGNYRVQWDGKNDYGQILPSGKYICLFRSGKYRRSRMLTLVR